MWCGTEIAYEISRRQSSMISKHKTEWGVAFQFGPTLRYCSYLEILLRGFSSCSRLCSSWIPTLPSRLFPCEHLVSLGSCVYFNLNITSTGLLTTFELCFWYDGILFPQYLANSQADIRSQGRKLEPARRYTLFPFASGWMIFVSCVPRFSLPPFLSLTARV